MAIVPNFKDLQRARRLATNNRLSFNRVVNNGSPASQGTAIPAVPPATVPEPVYNYVANNNVVIPITNLEVPNYFIVTTTVETFSALFDSQTLGFSNNFDVSDFALCNLSLNYGTGLSANNNVIFVTQSATLSSIFNNLYTVYYTNTGSLIVGFAPSQVYIPPITSYPPTPTPTPTPTVTPTGTPTVTPTITPTPTPTATNAPTFTPTPTPTITNTPTPTPTITPTSTPIPRATNICVSGGPVFDVQGSYTYSSGGNYWTKVLGGVFTARVVYNSSASIWIMARYINDGLVIVFYTNTTSPGSVNPPLTGWTIQGGSGGNPPPTISIGLCPTPTPTSTPTITPTPTPTPTLSATATPTPTPTITNTPTPTLSATATPTPTPTLSGAPTATPTPTPTITRTPTVTPTPTPIQPNTICVYNAGISDVNGIFTKDAGGLYYLKGNYMLYCNYWNNPFWILQQWTPSTIILYRNSSTTPYVVPLTGWTLDAGGIAPAPNLAVDACPTPTPTPTLTPTPTPTLSGAPTLTPTPTPTVTNTPTPTPTPLIGSIFNLVS